MIKTWYEATSIYVPGTSAQDNACRVMWTIKAALTGQLDGIPAIGTLAGSSDGVTGGMDGVDRLGTEYDASLWVRASAGTEHSWFAITLPESFAMGRGGPHTLVVSYSGSYLYVANLYVSTNGAATGGSVTADPTVPNSVSRANTYIAPSTSSTPHYINLVVSADGDMWLMIGKAGAIVAVFVLSSFVGKDADNHPFFVHSGATTNFSSTASLLGTSGLSMRSHSDDPYASFTGMALLPSATTYLFTDLIPVGGDAVDGSYPEAPVYVMPYSDSAHRSVRGYIPDVSWCPTAISGYNKPSTGDVTHCAFGGLWLPFTSSVTF